jgi:hypothetical protein
MEAYIHFGGVFTSEQPSPRLTIQTEVKEELLWWQKRNLMYTATGYGKRIPTTYMVKHNNRWKRVYCCIFSNSGTLFIEEKRKPIATVDIYNN